jgi:hypothetical protein
MFEENVVLFGEANWDLGGIASALCVLAVAYLRGNLRYRCLEKYNDPLNKKFILIWEQLRNDSRMNHQCVVDVLYSISNPVDVTQMMYLTMKNDERIVEEIEDYKKRKVRI